MKALEGIRVLDLTRALAGPFCTLMLGDNGADVIKIEIPGTGDDTRHWGPPFIESESAYYLSINRNKRSLTLNLRDPEAKEIFLKLVRTADVVVENFTPGVMGRFGLDYDAVQAINPGIIYCSISGFGQDGPYRERPAYDQIMQGLGGLMSVTGESEGEPQKIGLAITDIGAGMWAAFAIMAAFHHRGEEGKNQGQYIDISMLDSQIAWLTYQAAYFFATGTAPQRLGGGPSHAGALPGVCLPRRQTHQCRRGFRTHLGAFLQGNEPGGPVHQPGLFQQRGPGQQSGHFNPAFAGLFPYSPGG